MFESIPGQTAVKELFARAFRGGGLGHAYLLCGPEGLAKTAFARELGVALVAECGGCGGCPRCEAARRGLHPDLHLLEREGDVIRVEQVQSLIADLSLRPFAGARRVWIIPEVEHLNPAAANKLLKSIEEPPAHVFFLLVSDRVERVLPTIVSRCQVVEFSRLSAAEVRGYLLEEHALEGGEAEALARLAAGSVERAARLAEDHRGPGRRRAYLRWGALVAAGAYQAAGGAEAPAAEFIRVLEQHVADIRRMAEERLVARVAALKDQFQDERELKWQVKRAEAYARREELRLRRLAALDAVDTLTSWLRDLWVVACGASDVLWNCDRTEELARAAVATPEHYARSLAIVGQTRKSLYLNIDQKLALQAMFARFGEVAQSG